MDTVASWRNDTIGESTARSLKKNGFDAVYVKTGAEAAELVSKHLKKGATVGFGGSMTVKGLGIQEKAAAAGCEVLDHNVPGLAPEAKTKILKRQLTCDLFVSSSNAITLEGEIVTALSFGPTKTVVVVGVNKIVRDLDEAFARVESYAAPMNNKRLDRPNPCVKAGVCMDCDGDTRICRIYQILRKRPGGTDFTVIIVGEEMGY
jgi:hypothetical protein